MSCVLDSPRRAAPGRRRNKEQYQVQPQREYIVVVAEEVRFLELAHADPRLPRSCSCNVVVAAHGPDHDKVRSMDHHPDDSPGHKVDQNGRRLAAYHASDAERQKSPIEHDSSTDLHILTLRILVGHAGQNVISCHPRTTLELTRSHRARLDKVLKRKDEGTQPCNQVGGHCAEGPDPCGTRGNPGDPSAGQLASRLAGRVDVINLPVELDRDRLLLAEVLVVFRLLRRRRAKVMRR